MGTTGKGRGDRGDAVARIVIAGRPNAGKSTLFNRMVRRQKAVVAATPGVTRDENRARIHRRGRGMEIIDTGGIEQGELDGSLGARVRSRSATVLGEASVVVYLLDGKAGLSPADQSVAQEIRALGLPAVFVVNKVDLSQHELRVADFAGLGEDELVAISAAHGRGMDELWERIFAHLPEPAPADDAAAPSPAAETGAEGPAEGEEAAGPVHFALIGRPNVGKSSLLNRIVGFERCLVDSTPGTTRDAIDVHLRRGPRDYVVVDTAGLRRKSRIVEELDSHASAASIRALERADICVLVLDATTGVTDQDLRLADLAWKRGRGLVVAVNKGDLAPELSVKRCERMVVERLPLWPPLPVVRTSATLGQGLRGLFHAVDEVARGRATRVPTARLNELLEGIVDAHPPPLAQGKAVKLMYGTQVGTAPPHVALFTNRTGGIGDSYKRYLTHRLREALGLVGVPLHLSFRARTRRGVDEAPPATQNRRAPRGGKPSRQRRRR